MLKELKTSIENLETELSSSIYFNQLPEGNTDDAYATFYLISNSNDGSDTSHRYTTTKVQFNIFSKSTLDNGDACFSLFDEIKNVVKKENLSISGSISFVRNDFEIPPRIVENAFQGTIQYSINILNN